MNHEAVIAGVLVLCVVFFFIMFAAFMGRGTKAPVEKPKKPWTPEVKWVMSEELTEFGRMAAGLSPKACAPWDITPLCVDQSGVEDQ